MALRLALQMAEALEAAHESGVIHRDLKPANVKVTPAGRVKVLDFGLAKAFQTSDSRPDVTNSPTLSVVATQQGIILGTAGYMSPEQASGQPTDRRADVWSFGVVLFEMLTGQPLFGGKTVSHVLAEVLRVAPPWERLPSTLHPRVRLMLERCLEKEARDRYHDIADVRVDLERALADPTGGHPTRSSPASARPSRRAELLGTAAGGLVVAGLAGWFLRPVPEAAPPTVVRFPVTLPDGQQFTRPEASLVAVSPDGRRIAYIANSQVYVRNVDETDARPVPGTNESGLGPAGPVFSPDGQWLGYLHVVTGGGPYVLKRVPVAGGTPVRVFESGSRVHGLTWPTMDAMVFANQEGILRIPAGGGTPEVLAAAAENEVLMGPQILPDGGHILFTRLSGGGANVGLTRWDAGEILMQSIGADDRSLVWSGGGAPLYLSTGHLLYAQGNTLFAPAFDPGSREVGGGGPAPVVEGVQRSSDGISDTANYAISGTGTLVKVAPIVAAGAVDGVLALVDRGGRVEPRRHQDSRGRPNVPGSMSCSTGWKS